MLRRKLRLLGLSGAFLGVGLSIGEGGDRLLGHLRKEEAPPSLTEVARKIDHIQDSILNQGTVVTKQPDIWSQARMTMFRKEFEDTMSPEVAKFANYLSARIARSDSAQLQSQTQLGAVLTPFGPNSAGTGQFRPQISTQADLNTALSTTMAGQLDSTGKLLLPPLPDTATTGANFNLLSTSIGTPASPLSPPSLTAFGLEPNVHLDQKADYLNHLHRIRRVNLGDDNADSAGYGLYLMRVPVSIQPGDKTKKGFGAILNATMRHDFGPTFLPETYRNLVINDLVDLLRPVVHEMIRNGQAKKYHDAVDALHKAQNSKKQNLKNTNQRTKETDDLAKDVDQKQQDADAILNDLKSLSNFHSISRTGSRMYPIAPSDVKRVFVAQNLLNLAYSAQEAIGLGDPTIPTNEVKLTDVAAYLRHELEGAYGLIGSHNRPESNILQDAEYVEYLTEQVQARKFEGPKGVFVDSPEEINEFYTLYESFTHKLPGNIRFRPNGVLAWGIVIEAGLLNRQLREDMRQTKGAEGATVPPESESLFYYQPDPAPEAVSCFITYVKARWPMITFAIEPVVDEQNIEDSFTRRRDLQLAIAFSLSSGRISFRQAVQFTRQLQYEAQTIALNQTVVGFAHGNDTFGWRFSPRYQTPPEESNLRTVGNLLIRGGPGPNWQLDNSKLEPGLRELTAVVVMPSFVRGMRLDVSGDWFRLHDPDERTIHTARSIELGRKINEARDALEVACKCGKYRMEDIERLRVKLHQLEVMLPLQTQYVKVPYENTLGGFALFDQGVTALAPEVTGYEGIQYFNNEKVPGVTNDIIIYGRHFSIYENAVVAGGLTLPREGTGSYLTTNAEGVVQAPSGNLSVLRTPDGKLNYVSPTGAVTAVPDTGSYNVLSREVIRVRIPPGVATTRRVDGSDVVELYVSTPVGISNRLLIPVKPQDAPKPAAPTIPVVVSPVPPSPDPKYTLVDSSLPVVILRQTPAGGAKYVAPAAYDKGKVLRIAPLPAPDREPAPFINVWFSFDVSSGVTQSIPVMGVPLDKKTGFYEIDKKKLDAFAKNLFLLLNANGFFPAGDPPQASISSDNVVIQAASNDQGRKVTPEDNSLTNNRLKLAFEYLLLPNDPTPPPSPVPAGGASVTPRPTSGTPTEVAIHPSGPAPARSSPGDRPIDAATSRAAFAQVAPAAQPAAAAPVSPFPINLPPLPPTPPPTLPSTTNQSVLVIPRTAPASVNLSVPIVIPPPVKHSQGMFHRKPAMPTTPPSAASAAAATRPIKGPLLERLLGRP